MYHIAFAGDVKRVWFFAYDFAPKFHHELVGNRGDVDCYDTRWWKNIASDEHKYVRMGDEKRVASLLCVAPCLRCIIRLMFI